MLGGDLLRILADARTHIVVGHRARDAFVRSRLRAVFDCVCASFATGGTKARVPNRPRPLHGNRTSKALAKRIARTMPDDNVGACVGKDSEQVAAYIYEGVLFPAGAGAAASRGSSTFARLTIAQYRRRWRDIVGRFPPGFDNRRRGTRPDRALHRQRHRKPTPAQLDAAKPAEKPCGEKRAEEKGTGKGEIDSERTRTWPSASAVQARTPEKMAADEFSIRWEGLGAGEETGNYEIHREAPMNGVRLLGE